MKKIIIVSLAAALLAGGAFAAKFASGNEANDLFKSNIEALADEEIIVGELCAYQPDWSCWSLGEKFENNIKTSYSNDSLKIR